MAEIHTFTIEKKILKKIIIIGSSRKDGFTHKAVQQFNCFSDFDVVDLNDYNFTYYDYEHQNKNDDYISLMRKLVFKYDVFVFATPVYWYSMSGIMKVFFDRFTDLLDNEKVLGRKLRNKYMAVLTSSVGDHLGENFWLPFKETARYLGMEYLGNVHTLEKADNKKALDQFRETLLTHKDEN